VTIGLENVVFRKAIRMGSVLRFEIDLARRGRTSVTYNVRVFSDSIESGEKTTVFDNRITFVNIDEEGRKAPITPAEDVEIKAT